MTPTESKGSERAGREVAATHFDPYHSWLGIPPDEQPPNHYRLLGVPLFETQREVIQNAAYQRMTFLKSFGTGPHSAQSEKLLNEVSAAKVCLLNHDKKHKYDEQLWASSANVPSDHVNGEKQQLLPGDGSTVDAAASLPPLAEYHPPPKCAPRRPRLKPRMKQKLVIVLAILVALLFFLVAVFVLQLIRCS